MKLRPCFMLSGQDNGSGLLYSWVRHWAITAETPGHTISCMCYTLLGMYQQELTADNQSLTPWLHMK